MRGADNPRPEDVAIVGIGIHVPGAYGVEKFWQNLCGEVESIRALTDEELLAAGIPRQVFEGPDYVRSGAPLDGVAEFDPDFFGMGSQEGAVMDPQHRHLLECCWEALEDAGKIPSQFPGSIGVYAGCGMGTYFHRNVVTHADLMANQGYFLLRHTGNDKDFLATRISYALDLKGPSIGVQTACSTSLVAVHLACQALIFGECDLALAGGATIEIPNRQGYVFREDEILSPDGHCRPFDHKAAGTVFGSGAGAVVLRRLSDALADGDPIYAVIRGSAVNNDGGGKVGYLAPSVDGQAAAVAEALDVAEVQAGEIGYVEAHGTGTAGRRPDRDRRPERGVRPHGQRPRHQYCAIGSVKSEHRSPRHRRR